MTRVSFWIRRTDVPGPSIRVEWDPFAESVDAAIKRAIK